MLNARIGRTACLGLFLLSASCQKQVIQSDRIAPNDNRVPAGKLRRGVLELSLDITTARWYPDGPQGKSTLVLAFAEPGRAPQNPGPLIRVRSGTRIKVSVHNSLPDSTVVLYGLHARPGLRSDTVQIAPGGTRDIAFSAGEPGTYFYWGTTTHSSVDVRNGIDSQLHGAFIVDPASGSIPSDRVFVLSDWEKPPEDSLHAGAILRAINGLSWPQTERFTVNTGDTVRWRWVNPSDSPHPMHLHGFYFDVTSRGSWVADTLLTGDRRGRVVTEMPLSGSTFAMTWVPTEPGNWLLHCHVPFHTSMYLSPEEVQDPPDPLGVDGMRTMRGMVLAVTVKPGRSTARRPADVAGAREIRLVAQAAPKRFQDELDEMAFVLQAGEAPPAADSVPIPSSLLVLRRNEPVRITIVNHLRASTGVHWHGIEVPAYSDGVPGMSGMDKHIAPAIAPGDSFTAAFTPTRSGTFIYHAHSNELFQVNLGLYGALLVVDSGKYDPENERLIIIGGDGPGGRPARINGRVVPDTMRLKVGVPYRLRVINILPDWTTRIGLLREDSTVHWKALAKDGAELPASQQLSKLAEFIGGPGETMDFEYMPTSPGLLQFVVRQRAAGLWRRVLPIRVED